MNLTLVERIMLANQFEILAELGEEEEGEYNRRMADALRSGYELEYEDITGRYSQGDDSFTRDECLEVYDILDTFRALKRAMERLEVKPEVDTLDVEFAGFDGNHEKQYGYSHYLRQQGKWEELIPSHGLNSHHQTMPRYRRMVAAWKQVPRDRRYELTKEDVEAIAAAGRNQ